LRSYGAGYGRFKRCCAATGHPKRGRICRFVSGQTLLPEKRHEIRLRTRDASQVGSRRISAQTLHCHRVDLSGSSGSPRLLSRMIFSVQGPKPVEAKLSLGPAQRCTKGSTKPSAVSTSPSCIADMPYGPARSPLQPISISHGSALRYALFPGRPRHSIDRSVLMYADQRAVKHVHRRVVMRRSVAGMAAGDCGA